MEIVFVDTGAFYALANKGESHHNAVKRFIETASTQLVSTNFIFAETMSLITKRLGKDIAVSFGRGLKNSKRLNIFYLSEKYQEEAWDLFARYRDKDFDYIDATCFVFMEKMGIIKALSLDGHFKQMNFEMLP